MITLVLPADSQRAQLRDEVNRAYFEFLDQLDRPLQELGRQRSTFDGRPGSKKLTGLLSLNPLIVAAPWLFWGAYPMEFDKMAAIAAAGAYLGAAYTILDHLYDGQVEDPLPASLLQSAFFDRANELLAGQIDGRSPFWERMELLWQELLAALSRERRLYAGHSAVSEEEFIALSAAKAIPLIITSNALAYASNQLQLMDHAERSLRWVGPAVQLWHDVGDWLKDFQSRQITFYLSEVLHQFVSEKQKRSADGPATDFANESWLVEIDLAEFIAEKKLQARFWQRAYSWLGEALTHARPVNCATWNGYLQQWQEQVQVYIFSSKHPDDPRSRPLTLLQIFQRIVDAGE